MGWGSESTMAEWNRRMSAERDTEIRLSAEYGPRLLRRWAGSIESGPEIESNLTREYGPARCSA